MKDYDVIPKDAQAFIKGNFYKVGRFDRVFVWRCGEWLTGWPPAQNKRDLKLSKACIVRKHPTFNKLDDLAFSFDGEGDGINFTKRDDVAYPIQD